MKARSILLLPSILAGSLILHSCAKDALISPTPSIGSPSPMPLKVGNQWVYRRTGFDAKGDTSYTGLDTLRITGTQRLGVEIWYVTDHASLYTERRDGIWQANLSGTIITPIHYLPNPATLHATFGDLTYAITDPNGGSGGAIRFNYVVTDTATSVTTPAGTFTCFQYKSRYSNPGGTISPTLGVFDGDEVVYVAPGTGPVRGDIYSGSGASDARLDMHWELVSVTLN